MKKYIILLLLVFAGGYICLLYFPVILNVPSYCDFVFDPKANNNSENVFENYYNKSQLSKSDAFKLFEHFNFDEGDWRIGVIFKERCDILADIPKGKYLETKNIELIKKFKNLTFEYTGGDMCTVENILIISKNDKIVFCCDVALDSDGGGFQNRQFGWMKSIDNQLSELIKEFHKPFLPIVVY